MERVHGLHAFPAPRRRADNAHSYPRTPSFTWRPASQKGGHYQFELATSQSFESDGTIVFKDTKVPIPAETVGKAVPVMTGSPYALWAHVRWMSKDGLVCDAVERAVRVQHCAGATPRT